MMCNHRDALLFSASILHNGLWRSTLRLSALYSILNLSRCQEVDLHPLTMWGLSTSLRVKFCDVLHCSWPSRLDALCFASLLSRSRCRSATIDSESYEMEGKAPMLLQVCDRGAPSPSPPMAAKRRWEKYFEVGCFYSILDLSLSRSRSASLDHEGSKMEGRAPHWGWSFTRCCVVLGLQWKNGEIHASIQFWAHTEEN